MRERTPFQTVNVQSLGEVREFLRESMESEVHDFTQNGECSNCGACCSNALPMTETEIRDIRRYVKRNGIRERKRLLPVNGFTLDLTCPFRFTRRVRQCANISGATNPERKSRRTSGRTRRKCVW